MFYIIIPYFEPGHYDQSLEGLSTKSGYFSIFTCKKEQLRTVHKALEELTKRGDITEFMIMSAEDLQHALPAEELLKVIKNEKVNYLNRLLNL